MTQPTMQADGFADLPVLTEVVEVDAKIPILTEILAKEVPALVAQTALPLSDAECKQLAVRIAPQLEALLRNKFASHFDGLWQDAWREAQAGLPKLIRAQFAESPASAQSDIIAPPFRNGGNTQTEYAQTKHDNNGTRKKF